MTLFVALLLAAQPAAAVPATDGALLDSFRAACARVDDVAAMRADALGSGWTEIDSAAEPRMGRLLDQGRRSLPDGTRATWTLFRPAGGADDLFLTQTRVESMQGSRNVCRIYRFGAGAPIDPDLLDRWMARPPTRTEDLEGSGSSRVWEPGWRDGVAVQVTHVIANPTTEQLGFDGNILVARAAGDF